MGKKKMSPPKRLTAKISKKGARAKRQPVIRNCAKCLERHEAPTGKKCLRLQTPGLQVGAETLPGPPGLYPEHKPSLPDVPQSTPHLKTGR